MRYILSILSLLPFLLQAQVFNYKDYWKNRKPNAAYWQQDVHYTINAVINDSLDEISGDETLEYFNNSPDELTTVYFHLYQNAFQPNSYAHALNEVNKEETTFGKYEAKNMGTLINAFSVDGVPTTFTIDNTILIAKLPKPLASGASVKFTIRFKTYWDDGSMRRRFKIFSPDGKNKHYDGVHWYPRICVYDRKFGWETDQHLGKEFYGDYGVYDVKLTFPSNYVVEATGLLTNENEVMPADLRAKLDIANYSRPASADEKTKAVAGRVPTGYTYKIERNGTKTWSYHAENVHDFAFTADPTYRMAESMWNGIKCIALAQEQNAAQWYPTSEFVAKVVEIYSTDIGMYGYPKIVAADARDGMEYPMITLNGGNWPGHQYVIAHEVGHNWFFGMIGNNETYRAMLDEGFTQFLTSWSIKKFNNIPMHANSYDEQAVYNGYLNDAINKNDMPLNTHSDDFSSATGHGGGYRHVYYKTATMLYNLQYVLGDELFLKAMQHYFNKWKFAHPYPDDFRQAIIEYSKVDLNWFFDQWMETTKSIDYKIMGAKRIMKSVNDGKFRYAVRLKRKGEMQMPIDLTVSDRSGKSYQYLIPNTYFAKQEGRTVLNTWKGWGLLNQTYVDTIVLDHKIDVIEIDTTNRLADIYRIDNRMKRSEYKLPLKSKLNKGIAMGNSFNYRNMSWRPDLWFNAVDGMKVGLNTHFEYAKVKHVLDISVWYNTGLGAESSEYKSLRDPFSYRLQYKNLVGKDAYIFWDTRILDGIFYDNLGFEKSFGKNKFTFRYKSISMLDGKVIYWPYASKISREGKSNSSINIDYQRNYRYKKGNGVINSSLRGNGMSKDYSYASFKIEVINHNTLGKFDVHTRWFMQHIEGSAIPEEFMLNLAGANMEDMLESKFTRSRGWIPQQWLGYGATTNHFQMGGGLNLRGYAGYLAPVTANNLQYNMYQGTGGTSASIEIDFDRLVKFRPKLTRNFLKMDIYAFGDAGILYNSNITTDNLVSPLRMDAGLGSALSIYRWGKRNLIQPLTIRFDMPFVLNTQPFADKGYIQNRWVFGIGRSF
ncbi:MAG: M1 family metallopeptidase [Chitinophagaceae bacterium]